MQEAIQPKCGQMVATCSCGNVITTRSTMAKAIHIDVCSECHPFYTGKHRIVDSENLVKKFEKKRESAKADQLSSKREKQERRRQRTTSVSSGNKLTLKDMLSKVN